MQTYVNTKKVVAGLAHKKIRDWTNPARTHHFGENSQRLKVVNYFRKKAPSQIFGWALKRTLYLFDLPIKNVRQHQEDGRWFST